MKLVLDDGTEYAIDGVHEIYEHQPSFLWQLYPKPGVPQTVEAGQMGSVITGPVDVELSIHMVEMSPDVRRAFEQKLVEQVRRKEIPCDK